MFDLEVFLYGFCYFDTISTKAIRKMATGFLKAFQNAELPVICSAMSKMFVGGC